MFRMCIEIIQLSIMWLSGEGITEVTALLLTIGHVIATGHASK